ncbi:MAG: DoxX family protein [Bacteroidales bacterium]|nr:DoxX family protein [Bacteroidales bacterium]
MNGLKINRFAAWISILCAIVSAVAIVYVPAFSMVFLSLLLLNLVLPVLFRKGYSQPALTLCRLMVGGLFLFSSFVKGVDPLGTKYKILDYLEVYNLTWFSDIAMILACGMILAEFLVGICLVTNVFPRLAVLGATLLMLFFTTTTLFDALYDLVPDCGCFGTAIKMSNWQTFYKNLVINAVLLPLIFNNKQLKNRLTWRGQFVIGGLYALLFLGFEIYNYRHLPVIDFMNWKVGKQMRQDDAPAQQVYLTFRNKADGTTQEYLSPDYPWNDSLWMSQWEFVDQRVEGGAEYLGFTANDADGNDMTDMLLSTENLLMFTTHDLGGITDDEWTKIKEITEMADENGFYVVWAVATTPEVMAQWQEKHDFIYEVYYGDELEIKTLVRFNPGLMWLDNGLVKDKWSAVDFNRAKRIFNR